MKEIIKSEIEQTFDVLNQIVPIKVNFFFKHKVLQEISKEAPVQQTFFSWFSPQFQLAAITLVLFLNVGTVFYSYSGSTESSTNDLINFAQEYALQTNTNSILN